MPLDTDDFDVFLDTEEFAVSVTATDWGTTFNAIFDTDYVEVDEVPREAPVLLMATADVDAAVSSGDRFVVNSTTYKLVDHHYAEPGMTRLVLALNA